MNAGTVEDWILSKAPMPWSRRVKIAIDVAAGMSYLHSKGVFHRDLTSKVGSPLNLVIKLCTPQYVIPSCHVWITHKHKWYK